jgi:hypothetical protein
MKYNSFEDFLEHNNITFDTFIEAVFRTKVKYSSGYNFRQASDIYENFLRSRYLNDVPARLLPDLFDKGIDWSINKEYEWGQVNINWNHYLENLEKTPFSLLKTTPIKKSSLKDNLEFIKKIGDPLKEEYPEFCKEIV